jgi:hypothetical protein
LPGGCHAAADDVEVVLPSLRGVIACHGGVVGW